jgi:segregation and condensation protein B
LPKKERMPILESEQDKQRRDLATLEAALYVSGRPLDLKTLGYIVKTRSKKKVQQLARMLADEYKKRDTALEVLELADQRFVLQLKSDYSSRVRRLAVRPLLTDGPLRTLAYIAYRQPVLQKQVIDARGTHAYYHVRQLVDIGLVEREKRGRNKALRVTEYFADYFGLSHDSRTMKRQLNRIFNNVMDEASEGDEEKEASVE